MKWRTLQPTTFVQVARVNHVLGSCKGLVTNWRFVHQRKEGYYKMKSNWVSERRFNCRLVFWDKLGSLVRFPILVTTWLLISGFLGVVTLKSFGGIFILQGFPHLSTNYRVKFIFRCILYFWWFIGAFMICMQLNLINQLG